MAPAEGTDVGPDPLFRALVWLALPAYPLAVYCTWNYPNVTHEVSPGLIVALALVVVPVLHGAKLGFIHSLGGAALRHRKCKPPTNAASESAVDKFTRLQGEERKFLSRTWKVVELSLLVVLGWWIVRAKPFFPASLGGPGQMEFMFPSGAHSVPQSLAVYHAVRFGYLMEWWIFEDGCDRPDITMHHIATSIVLCCAVLAGWTEFGSIIIFIHDAWNFPVQLLVWMSQVHSPIVGILIAYFSSLYATGHFVFYCFVVEVIWPSCTEEHLQTTEWKIYWCMFGLLLIHHIYAFVRLLSYLPGALKSPNKAVDKSVENAAGNQH